MLTDKAKEEFKCNYYENKKGEKMNKYQKALENIKQSLGDLIDFNACKESIKILEELVEQTDDKQNRGEDNAK